MSLIPDAAELDTWRGVLERRFIAAAQSEDSYAAAARKAHREATRWIHGDVKGKGSFLWTCDLLGLEPDAVRRALKTKGAAALKELL